MSTTPHRQYTAQRIARPLAEAPWLPFQHVGVVFQAVDGRPFTFGNAGVWVTELVLHLGKDGGKPRLIVADREGFRGTVAKPHEVIVTGQQVVLTEAEINRRAAVAEASIKDKDYEVVMRDCECVVSRILWDDERHVQFAVGLGVLAVVGLVLVAARGRAA